MNERPKAAAVREHDHRALVELPLGRIYTPDVPIDDPSLYSGREEEIRKCRRLLATAGVTLVMYGERGIGKTSLANVLLQDRRPVRRQASRGVTLETIFGDVLRELGLGLTTSEFAVRGSAGLSTPLKLDVGVDQKRTPLVGEKLDVNVVTRRLSTPGVPTGAIVIDEAQELTDDGGSLDIAALAKAWGDARLPMALVLIGVKGELKPLADRLRRYGGRNVHDVALGPLSAQDTRDIISRREPLGVRVTEAASGRATELAGGYPWIMHRLMFNAAYAWLDRQPASAIMLPPASRFRAFGRRLTPEINLQALNVVIDVQDVDAALREFLSDLCRHHESIDVTALLEQLQGARMTLPVLARRLRPPPPPPAFEPWVQAAAAISPGPEPDAWAAAPVAEYLPALNKRNPAAVRPQSDDRRRRRSPRGVIRDFLKYVFGPP